MSEEIVYIDYDEALTIYGKMIDASDGGFEIGRASCRERV